jgi:hypothetical protein
MKTHPLGSVNPCGYATIFQGTKAIARCFDTPNARAYAFRIHPNATHAMAHYPGFKSERIDRHDWQGSTLTNEQAGYVAF